MNFMTTTTLRVDVHTGVISLLAQWWCIQEEAYQQWSHPALEKLYKRVLCIRPKKKMK